MSWDGVRCAFMPEELDRLAAAHREAVEIYRVRHGSGNLDSARRELARAIMDLARLGEDEPFFLARAALGRVVGQAGADRRVDGIADDLSNPPEDESETSFTAKTGRAG